MSVNVTEYESTLGHDGLRIRILPTNKGVAFSDAL